MCRYCLYMKYLKYPNFKFLLGFFGFSFLCACSSFFFLMSLFSPEGDFPEIYYYFKISNMVNITNTQFSFHFYLGEIIFTNLLKVRGQ